MVSTERRLQIEETLRYMLIGQRFCRAHFYAGTPILFLWGPTPAGIGSWFSTDDDNAVHIWVESRWQLFDSPPPLWPRLAEDVPEQPIEELVRIACALRNNAIVDVRLGIEFPHLLLTFDDGRVLYLNGHHDLYESWQVWAGQGKYLVVAVPGDDLAMWLPVDFRQHSAEFSG